MMSTNIFRSASSFCFGFAIATTGLLISQAQSAQASTAGIIGQDNRFQPSYSYMLNTGRHATGQLEIQKADGLYYTCTFTAVGRNIGLTNAHCLLDAQGKAPRQIKAFAVKHGNQVFAASNVHSYWLGRNSSPTTLGEFSRDWAVIRFSDTNFTNQTGWAGNISYSNDVSSAGRTAVGQNANLVGYSGDIRGGSVPSAHLNCQLQSMNSAAGIMQHNCDMTPGASGSGIHNNSRQLQVLNAGAAMDRNGQTIYNIGVPLERFMPAVQVLRNNGGNTNTSVPTP
jgi:V8-like Glu-specific endopeptidase